LSRISLKINNWDKYNPRNDVKKPSWFRLEHEIFDGSDFVEFNSDELLAFIYILAMASRENKGGSVCLNTVHAERNRIKEKTLRSVIEKLITQEMEMAQLVDDTGGLSCFKKVEARNMVKTAVINGTLKKPASCSECGAENVRIDGHHEDYDKPLDVVWLCAACHGKRHTIEYERKRTQTNAHERTRTQTCTTYGTGRDVRDVRTGRDETPDLDPADLRNLWNDNCSTLPKCKNLSEKRIKVCRAQIKKYPDKPHWIDAINKFTCSKFCIEQWKPGFDDWLSEDKRIRAIEGRYDGNRSGPKTFSEQTFEANKQTWEAIDAMEVTDDNTQTKGIS